LILFENESYLALDKPSGLSMATRAGNDPVARLLEAAGIGYSPEILLVHRLDVGTSGVVLLAKNSAAHRGMSLCFQRREVRKIYRAIAWGHPVPASGRIDASLALDRSDRRKMKVAAEGKASATDYRTLERPASISHLELSPATGRTHQIRVHLASKGHPVVGDDLYGGPRWRGVRDSGLKRALESVSRLLLHAHRLEFTDPLTGSRISIESPEPDDFASLLSAARGSRPRGDHSG
jgi:23S rRNA pseudouridine1911/1915/1917 synthase